MINLRGVEKYYYDKLIVRIPEFTFDAGITWIAGVNGSGKTTLLKAISGMIPFNGDVILTGTSLNKKPVAYRRMISYAEAEPLYPAFVTGWHLVRYYQSTRKASDENVGELVRLSALEQQLKNPVGTYSSGMVKRLSLLLALMGHVPLILLDEPLATLDAAGVETLPVLMQEYRKRYETSFIFSSHQALPPSLHIDHKYVIDNNTIQQIK